MDKAIIARAARAFEALSFEAENAEIDRLSSDLQAADKAAERARRRASQIGDLRRDYRGPDGASVADALLADANVTDAAIAGQSLAALEEEQTALSAGVREIGNRCRAYQEAIDQVRADSATRLAAEAQELTDALIADAQRSARELLDTFAALFAVNRAARTGASELNQMSGAIEALFSNRGLMQWTKTAEVPREIVDCLAPLKNKGRALPCAIVERVALP